MPIFTIAEKNTMLDAADVASISLHTAYDAGGANQVVGGTPAYARLSVLFAAAVSGQKAMLAPPTFDVPAATTVQFVGMWDGSGIFVGMSPAGGDGLRPFALVDLAGGNLACPNHGFSVNDTLVAWSGSAGALPSVMAEGTVYTVIFATTDTLQISTVSGGSSLSFSVSGNGFLQRIVPVTYTSQGTFPVSSFVLDARAAA